MYYKLFQFFIIFRAQKCPITVALLILASTACKKGKALQIAI